MTALRNNVLKKEAEMKTAKHTPGPWLQDFDCSEPSGCSSKSKYEGFQVVDEDNWPIAFLPVFFDESPTKRYPSKTAIDWDEQAANLRLISAAPKLLAALKELVAEFGVDGHGGELDEGESLAIDKARSAITDATSVR